MQRNLKRIPAANLAAVKNSAVSLICLLCLLFGVLLTGFASVGNTLYTVNSDTQAVIVSQNLSPVSVAGTTEKMYVYDANDNQLYYNRVTGMVFTTAGVVYNQDSQPLTYDDDKQVFEDSIQRRLDLVERSTHGLQNYYLMFGEYHVNSIKVEDTLFIVGIKAKTAYNSGKAYDMLIKRVWVKYSGWESFVRGLAGDYSGGYYKYYDLHSHEINSKYFEQTNSGILLAGAGTKVISGSFLTKFEKWGTLLDLLDEIVYLMELVPPTGSPMGEFALNTATGACLRDDRGQKIRISDNGQLIDP